MYIIDHTLENPSLFHTFCSNQLQCASYVNQLLSLRASFTELLCHTSYFLSSGQEESIRQYSGQLQDFSDFSFLKMKLHLRRLASHPKFVQRHRINCSFHPVYSLALIQSPWSSYSVTTTLYYRPLHLLDGYNWGYQTVGKFFIGAFWKQILNNNGFSLTFRICLSTHRERGPEDLTIERVSLFEPVEDENLNIDLSCTLLLCAKQYLSINTYILRNARGSRVLIFAFVISFLSSNEFLSIFSLTCCHYC